MDLFNVQVSKIDQCLQNFWIFYFLGSFGSRKLRLSLFMPANQVVHSPFISACKNNNSRKGKSKENQLIVVLVLFSGDFLFWALLKGLLGSIFYWF